MNRVGHSEDMAVTEIVDRITERLRRDHPDPAMRTKLYDDGKLLDYVRTLAPEIDDDDTLAEIANAVKSNDDGTPAHHE